MWLKLYLAACRMGAFPSVSVLYREPMWLKFQFRTRRKSAIVVSVLYREPMWLK